MTIIDACLGYQKLKLNKSHLAQHTFACQFGMNRFGLADDILIVGYDPDGRDYNRTLR